MIETLRLRCEPVTPAHAGAMFPVLSEPRIYTWIPGGPPASVAALRERYAFLSGGESPDGTERWLNWMLFLAATDTPIGFWQATVRPARTSVAYVLHPDWWGAGLAHEASAALITHLFECHGPPALFAEIHADNRPSIALVERLGFVHAGRDEAEDDEIYRLDRGTWGGA